MNKEEFLKKLSDDVFYMEDEEVVETAKMYLSERYETSCSLRSGITFKR